MFLEDILRLVVFDSIVWMLLGKIYMDGGKRLHMCQWALSDCVYMFEILVLARIEACFLARFLSCWSLLFLLNMFKSGLYINRLLLSLMFKPGLYIFYLAQSSDADRFSMAIYFYVSLS